jgi:peptide/nickel transport system substrate-binding protein
MNGKRRSRAWRRFLSAVAATSTILGLGYAIPAASAAVSAAAPARGGTLTIVAVGLDWIDLDPINPEDFPVWYVGNGIYDSLFYLQDDGKLSPDLATGYQWSDGNKVLTIELRHGVMFQDGTPFNAAAAVYNLQRGANPSLGSECVPDFSTVKSITAPSTYAVQIDFSRTNSAVPAFLGSTPCGMMASPTAIKKYGASYGQHPVGTGPFELVKEATDSYIELQRNPNYWQKGRPYLNEVKILSVASAASAVDSLEAGTAQIAVAAEGQEVEQAKTDGNLKVLPLGAFTSQPIWFNVTRPPFNNVLARRAVVEATDPAPIIKSLQYGLASPTESMVGPSSWAFPGAKIPGYPSYNVAAAKALVKKLGGLNVTLSVASAPTGGGSIQEGSVLAAQWNQAGIKTTIDPENVVTLLGNAHKKNYQVMDLVTPGSIEPDTTLYRNLFCESALNQTGYCNKSADQALIAGEAATTIAGRKAAYGQLFKVLAQQVPYGYLYSPQIFDITTKNVHGFTPNGTEWVELQGTWLSAA